MNEGKRGEAAPRQLSGRGLAYWTDGREDRIIYVTPGYQMVALDAKTGAPVHELRQGRRRRSEAGRRPGDGSRHRRGRPARGADRRQRRRSSSARRTCPAASPQEQDEREGLRPRLRRAHRQAALDLPHDSASGRIRQRHLGERLVVVHRQRRRLGADERRSKSSAWSICRSNCRPATTTAAIGPATACSARASSRST